MSTENNSVLFGKKKKIYNFDLYYLLGGQLNINEMEKEDNEADAPD